jgi:hypothetical protein
MLHMLWSHPPNVVDNCWRDMRASKIWSHALVGADRSLSGNRQSRPVFEFSRILKRFAGLG